MITDQRVKRPSELFAHGDRRPTNAVTNQDLADLPAPVRRLLRASRAVGTAIPRTVRIRQRGSLVLHRGESPVPFRAKEYFTTRPPGFLWDAHLEVAPFAWSRVRQGFCAGRGTLVTRYSPMLAAGDAPASRIDAWALERYLAETMWFPAALTEPGMSWEAMDRRSARVTLHAGVVEATAVFHVADDGLLLEVTGDTATGASAGGVWTAAVTRYGDLAGLHLPVASETVRSEEPGALTLVRVEVTDLEYGVAQRW